MVISFLIATLIIFLLNLFITLLSISNQYGDDQEGVEVFRVITLGAVLVMITWNILAIVYN
jgi:hypothetical protein